MDKGDTRSKPSVLLAVVAAALLGPACADEAKDPAAAELGQFRTAMYNRCRDPAFKGPPAADLVRTYADNAQLRQRVVAQFHALQRGQASCQEILQALRAAGYPAQ